MTHGTHHLINQLNVPNIVPFTTRDAISALELYKELADYVKEQLHPNLVHVVDDLVTQFEKSLGDHHTKYLEGIEDFQRIHDAFMSDVTAKLTALNDHAVTNLLNDDTSMLHRVLSDMFVDRQDKVFSPTELTHSALQYAANQAAEHGGILWAAGTIETDQTLFIMSDAELSNLTIRYRGGGVAVQVGNESTNTHRLSLRLPKVWNPGKPSVGWGRVEGTVGVRLVNLYSCDHVNIPHVGHFETGLKVEGNGSGCVHNTFMLGHLDNNKRNLHIATPNDGWAGSNTFMTGRLSHVRAEGDFVPGVEQIIMDNHNRRKPDNNLFVNTSVEGFAAEYVLSVAGQHNIFLNNRFEPAELTVRWLEDSQRNTIIGGWQEYRLKEHMEPGSSTNSIHGATIRHRMSGQDPLYQVWNVSRGPGFALYSLNGAYEQNLDAWTAIVDYENMSVKRAGDEHPTAKLQAWPPRVLMGMGDSEPDRGIGIAGNNISILGGDLVFPQNHSIGPSPSSAPLTLQVVEHIKTGYFGRANLPSASAAGRGAMVYNSSANRPVWSDGTNWRFADGEIV